MKRKVCWENVLLRMERLLFAMFAILLIVTLSILVYHGVMEAQG